METSTDKLRKRSSFHVSCMDTEREETPTRLRGLPLCLLPSRSKKKELQDETYHIPDTDGITDEGKNERTVAQHSRLTFRRLRTWPCFTMSSANELVEEIADKVDDRANKY